MTAQAISVAPKITSTSPGSDAPATIWSHRASMVPPVTMVSVPGSVPAGTPIGTTMGSCASSTPSDASRSLFHRPSMWSDPSDAVTAVSTAGKPERALVATA